MPVSCLIGQPLANDAAKRGFGALLVINAKRDPLIIPEIELREIAMKMLFGTVLIDAFHDALG